MSLGSAIGAHCEWEGFVCVGIQTQPYCYWCCWTRWHQSEPHVSNILGIFVKEGVSVLH